MPLIELNRDPTPHQVRQFALVWLPAFLLSAAAACVYYRMWPLAVSLALGAVVSMVLGLTQARVMSAVLIAWTVITFPLGWVVAHGMLFVVYYGIVTPIGLVMRAMGRDPLTRKFDGHATSYWVRRPPPRESDSYFRQF